MLLGKSFSSGSLVDSRPLESFDHLEKTFQDFKVIKLDKEKSNVVLSRKAVQEDLNSEEREKIFATIQEGSLISGIVKNLTDYGAFVDLGGVDGLLHITDITWKRINHPSEVLNVGDKLDFKVTNFDKEKLRISLGLKQLTNDPWENIKDSFKLTLFTKLKFLVLQNTDFLQNWIQTPKDWFTFLKLIGLTKASIPPSCLFR